MVRVVNLKKIKFDTDSTYSKPGTLDDLLPPKDDTDVLVSFHLNHLEQLHRIVHIPTFQRDYANVTGGFASNL